MTNVMTSKMYRGCQLENYYKHILLLKKKQKDKTQAKQRRQSSPITYIAKHTIEHYNIELPTLNKR